MTVGLRRVTESLRLWGDRSTHRNNTLVFGLLALGLFCGTASVKTIEGKIALNLTALGTLTMAWQSHKRHHFSDVMAGAMETAAIEGFLEELSKKALPIDAKSEPEPEPETIEAEVVEDEFFLNLPEDRVGRAIALVLMTLGVKTQVAAIQDGLAFTRYLLRPDGGVKAASILDKANDLRVQCGFSSEPMIGVVSGAVAIDVPKESRQFAKYSDYANVEPQGECWLPIGVNQLTGELVGIDFADSNSPHCLIGAVTGGGKSELLRSMTRYGLDNYDRSALQFELIDPKMSTWEDFGVPVIHDPVEAIAKIFRLVKMMELRRQVRAKVGCKDVATYNAQSDRAWHRVICAIEEIKDLVDALKFAPQSKLDELNELMTDAFDSEMTIGNGKGQMKPTTAILMAMARIGQAGRSEGIHLIGVTQEPDKALLEDLMSNLPVRIALKMRSHVEAGILQLPGAEKLLGKGDMLMALPGRSIERLQSLYLG
jgi:DNA segregation ATPase FtsK/SpoIIIE, S-DNA-T family